MKSNLFFLIETSKIAFTYVDEQIANFFLEKHPPIKQSVLAKQINVSTASITRFCKKIGFENYKEFIYQYKQALEDYPENESNVTNNLQFQYLELIKEINEKIDNESIKRVCEYIYDHKIIHIYGLGLSAIAGEDFKFRFTRLGKYVEIVRDYDSIEMVSSLMKENNLLFYLTLRGENKNIIPVIKRVKEKGTKVVVVTSNQSEEIAELADYLLLTSDLKNAGNIGQLSGQIPMLVIIDLIYSQYINMYRENINKWIGTEYAFLHRKPKSGTEGSDPNVPVN
ncbi:MurR/RpiR family transcriptional regulator [Paraliobacillus salinarum]|uniref:MurR/RpiR family transcriptional regulator n=1 Tax=Paraliobacillus salinarum TaxID=1158996 RepID=UPI0015F502F4|nr:MurR/RpiR family transcriptional regulator [Paraliobacillus salinarum]